MKITYDPTVDAAYVHLVDEIGLGGAASTVPIDPAAGAGMVNLDFDREGRLIGIEVLDATAKLPAELPARRLCRPPARA